MYAAAAAGTPSLAIGMCVEACAQFVPGTAGLAIEADSASVFVTAPPPASAVGGNTLLTECTRLDAVYGTFNATETLTPLIDSLLSGLNVTLVVLGSSTSARQLAVQHVVEHLSSALPAAVSAKEAAAAAEDAAHTYHTELSLSAVAVLEDQDVGHDRQPAPSLVDLLSFHSSHSYNQHSSASSSSSSAVPLTVVVDDDDGVYVRGSTVLQPLRTSTDLSRCLGTAADALFSHSSSSSTGHGSGGSSAPDGHAGSGNKGNKLSAAVTGPHGSIHLGYRGALLPSAATAHGLFTLTLQQALLPAVQLPPSASGKLGATGEGSGDSANSDGDDSPRSPSELAAEVAAAAAQEKREEAASSSRRHEQAQVLASQLNIFSIDTNPMTEHGAPNTGVAAFQQLLASVAEGQSVHAASSGSYGYGGTHRALWPPAAPSAPAEQVDTTVHHPLVALLQERIGGNALCVGMLALSPAGATADSALAACRTAAALRAGRCYPIVCDGNTLRLLAQQRQALRTALTAAVRHGLASALPALHAHSHSHSHSHSHAHPHTAIQGEEKELHLTSALLEAQIKLLDMTDELQQAREATAAAEAEVVALREGAAAAHSSSAGATEARAASSDAVVPDPRDSGAFYSHVLQERTSQLLQLLDQLASLQSVSAAAYRPAHDAAADSTALWAHLAESQRRKTTLLAYCCALRRRIADLTHNAEERRHLLAALPDLPALHSAEGSSIGGGGIDLERTLLLDAALGVATVAPPPPDSSTAAADSDGSAASALGSLSYDELRGRVGGLHEQLKAAKQQAVQREEDLHLQLQQQVQHMQQVQQQMQAMRTAEAAQQAAAAEQASRAQVMRAALRRAKEGLEAAQQERSRLLTLATAAPDREGLVSSLKVLREHVSKLQARVAELQSDNARLKGEAAAASYTVAPPLQLVPGSAGASAADSTKPQLLKSPLAAGRAGGNSSTRSSNALPTPPPDSPARSKDQSLRLPSI